MQFNRYLTYSKKRPLFRVAIWLLKAAIIITSFYYVVNNLIKEQISFYELIPFFKAKKFIFILGLLLLLMIVNWLSESKKWQILVYKYEKISLSTAFKSILAGVSMDAFLPFGAGAISSKVFSLKNTARKKIIGPIILAQGVQFFWTAVFGLIGLNQLFQFTNVFSLYDFPNIYILILSLLLMVYIYYSSYITYLARSIKNISFFTWSAVVLLSLLRYVVFLSQFLIISIYLAPEIPVIVLVGCITWMFFAKTVVPKPGHLGGLGIRGGAVVFFLGLAGYASHQVVLATIILWFINLAIPSVVGWFFIKDLKLRKIQE